MLEYEIKAEIKLKDGTEFDYLTIITTLTITTVTITTITPITTITITTITPITTLTPITTQTFVKLHETIIEQLCNNRNYRETTVKQPWNYSETTSKQFKQ